MIRICVKSGIKQLPWFGAEDFLYFEAYLGCDDDPAQLLNTKMRLISIHLPTQVRVGDRIMAMNFNPSPPAVEASKKKLVELLAFAKMHSVENIILHAGTFNVFTENREDVIADVAHYFESLAAEPVNLCPENVPCWFDLSFDTEPICVDATHFQQLRDKFQRIGITFDIDHAAINAIFQSIYQKYKKEAILKTNKAPLRNKMAEEVNRLTRENVDHCSALVNDAVVEFLAEVRPTVIHATGSDFYQYRPYDSLPLIGEALPMGFQGGIAGQIVRDRLDHDRWLTKLIEQKSNVALTMELLIRPDYDYVDRLKRNVAYLRKIINSKIKTSCPR